MCGIWLLLSKNRLTKITEHFEAFMKLQHRGPDNTNFSILSEFNTIIGFHRLAINGLLKQSANQPFIYDTEDTVSYVICNGEIYNYIELSKKYNIELSSGSDCEIIYPLYKKIGINSLMKEMVAEFSLIICEINKITKKVSLTIGRDQSGIRPLFIYSTNNEICFSSEMKGFINLNNQITYDDISIYKGNYNDNFKVQQFNPRCYLTLTSDDDFTNLSFNQYIDFSQIKQTVFNKNEALILIREKFIKSIEYMMLSDKEFGCLLSGGLDSSLVSAVASDICRKRGKKLKTFCIGMDENSPDIKYAKIVADYIQSEHTTIILPEKVWLEAINKVIYIIESYDTTTVRASTGQYLVSKWIAENTDIKVLLIGDLADELKGGYLYFLKAPNNIEFQEEVLKLLNNVHYFDVLRSDRGISSNSIECRCPENLFLNSYLTIDINLRFPTDGIEKSLMREAFSETNLLPKTVLYRTKNAFSDGVSLETRSWYSILQEQIENIISNEQFELERKTYIHMKPELKESLYYRKIFEKYFGKSDTVAKTIPYFWLPNEKWVGKQNDPSARTLNIYKERIINDTF